MARELYGHGKGSKVLRYRPDPNGLNAFLKDFVSVQKGDVPGFKMFDNTRDGLNGFIARIKPMLEAGDLSEHQIRMLIVEGVATMNAVRKDQAAFIKARTESLVSNLNEAIAKCEDEAVSLRLRSVRDDHCNALLDRVYTDEDRGARPYTSFGEILVRFKAAFQAYLEATKESRRVADEAEQARSAAEKRRQFQGARKTLSELVSLVTGAR